MADLAGVISEYTDQRGIRHETSDATRSALLGAMGFDVSSKAAIGAALAAERARRADRPVPDYLVAEPDAALVLQVPAGAHWRLECEDGEEFQGVARERLALPELGVGIHRLWVAGALCTLLVAPPRLARPARGWGITLPLYGLRSPQQGGIGDYEDLRSAVVGLAGVGAGFVGINPIHAGFPTDPGIISPYMPSHRRRLSAAHLHVPALAGARRGALIDYAAELAAKTAALEAAYAEAGEDDGFSAFLTREGPALERFATYQALAEVHGAAWQDWPAPYRDPAGAAVARFARAESDRIRYHAWLQYRAETELAAVADAATEAGMAHGLYLDLAVGTHPFGAETWAEPEIFAPGVSLGAPPDAFAEGGQTWLLAPMNPRALIADSFAPLALTLRKQLQFAGALRIDHILGFDRAFWVPLDGSCAGAYVRMPKEAMLAVVRIEAARAGAVIVGEDLGNISDGLQGDLEASGILGCRVAMFETARPGGVPAKRYTAQALASFGTHDLPTWAGWRTGTDIDLRRSLGTLTDAAAADADDERRKAVAAMDRAIGDGSGDVDAMHRFMGQVAACLVALQIEDILGIAEQPNLPGTVDEYPNWRRRLPCKADRLGTHPAVRKAAAIMRASGR